MEMGRSRARACAPAYPNIIHHLAQYTALLLREEGHNIYPELSIGVSLCPTSAHHLNPSDAFQVLFAELNLWRLRFPSAW